MMKRASLLRFMFVAVTTTLGLTGTATASHWSPPEGLVCAYNGSDTLSANWNELAGAKGYAVEVTASYDMSGNGSADRSQKFLVKTRESTILMELGKLEAAFFDDASNTVVKKKPMSAMLRVKGKHLGRGYHKRDGDDDDDEGRRTYKKPKYKKLKYKKLKYKKLKYKERDEDESRDSKKRHKYGHSRKDSPYSQYCQVVVEVKPCHFCR